MSRNGPEYKEMFDRSGYFEREMAIKYWFINNATTLWEKYNKDKPEEEKLSYNMWLKKIYGLNSEEISKVYAIMKKDEKNKEIFSDTEAKITAGEVNPFQISEIWAKGVITRRKCSEAGKLGQEAWQANGKKHGKQIKTDGPGQPGGEDR